MHLCKHNPNKCNQNLWFKDILFEYILMEDNKGMTAVDYYENSQYLNR